MDAVIQQGDVELRRITELPHGAAAVQPGPIGHVLATGESTGHAHTIESTKARTFRLGERLFVEVTEPAELEHQEHATVTLPVGTYEVGLVREFDPFAEAARSVAD